MKMEAESGVMNPQAKGTAGNHQELEEARTDPKLEPLEEVWPG